MKLLLAAACILIYSACKTPRNNQTVNLETTITQYLGGEYNKTTNSDSTYILAWTNKADTEPIVLQYAVYELKTGKQIYSGTAIRGKVNWLDDNTLEVYDYPGIIDDQNPLFRYKIDLRTKKKTALREENTY